MALETKRRRGGKREPERTRQLILEGAIAEFAEHGPGGARVDRIAARAKINKRMLYHYFGNKDALFLAVLEETYARIRSAERALDLERTEPREAIARLVAFTWHYYLDHPEFISLLNSENMHKAAHLERSDEVRSMHSPFVEMIGDILKRGVAAGVFRAGVDPVQLYISIAALGYFYLSNSHTLSAIFADDLAAAPALDRRLAHITEVVLAYLAPAN